VVALLQRLRSRNLPERIDAEYLRDASIPEGTVGRTLFAIRFLGLIDDADEPTQALRSIHTSTDEEYKTNLGGLIRKAYGEVFEVINPAEDGQERILNVFRRYTPASQRNRMVIFFLGMCREAGIPTLDVPRQRAMGEPKAAAPRARTGRASLRGAGTLRARGTVQSPDIPPALEGLVRSLPAPGTPLSAERREQWVEMARATLTFVYPEESAPDATPEEEQQSGE